MTQSGKSIMPNIAETSKAKNARPQKSILQKPKNEKISCVLQGKIYDILIKNADIWKEMCVCVYSHSN